MKKFALLLVLVALVAFTLPAYAGGHNYYGKKLVKCNDCYGQAYYDGSSKKPVIDIPVQPPMIYIPAPLPEPKHKLLYEFSTKAEWDPKSVLNMKTPVDMNDHRGFIQAAGSNSLYRNVRVFDKVRPVIKSK